MVLAGSHRKRLAGERSQSVDERYSWQTFALIPG